MNCIMNMVVLSTQSPPCDLSLQFAENSRAGLGLRRMSGDLRAGVSTATQLALETRPLGQSSSVPALNLASLQR